MACSPASAHTISQNYAYNGVFPAASFNGSDAVGTPQSPAFPNPFDPLVHGDNTIETMAFDKVSERMYVSDQGLIYKFNSAGVSQPFSALTPITVLNTEVDMSKDSPPALGVDNSATATQGRIYTTLGGQLIGFSSSGAPLGEPFPINGPGIDGFATPCGVGVDPSGNIWVNDRGSAAQSGPGLYKYTSAGVFTGTVLHPPSVNGCRLEIDSKGNFYTQSSGYSALIYKTSPTGVLLGTFGPEFAGVNAAAVDLSNDDVYLDFGGHIGHYSSSGQLISQFAGVEPAASYPSLGYDAHPQQGSYSLTVDPATHYVYAGATRQPSSWSGAGTLVDTFKPTGPYIVVPDATTNAATSITRTSANISGVVNADSVPTTDCKFEWGTTTSFAGAPIPCAEGNVFGDGANHPVTASFPPLTAGTTYHVRLTVTNANGVTKGNDEPFTTLPAVKDIHTDEATNITLTTAKLHGSFDTESLTTNYYFEYGPTTSYGSKTALPPGPVAGGNSVSADVSGLSKGVVYHYRIVASNSYGTTKAQDDQTFLTADPPSVSNKQSVTQVKSDSALVHFEINPNGASSTYHVEYGTEDCGISVCQQAEDVPMFPDLKFKSLTFRVLGLTPGVKYHYRVVAENLRGSTASTLDHTFTTFATPVFSESCPNSLARQQTGSAFLLDCRAYEIVSAVDAGGYNVESDLIPGQEPLDGYPQASGPSQVLYAVHNGGIPGTGNPTNRGPDPYVATRGSDGWETTYVGIPANGAPNSAPFASTLLGADSGLDTFAFGGSDICDPCFADGSKGIPIHNPDGSLTQGMVGSMPVSDPVSSGTVMKPFSSNGAHFVFGSEQQFEPEGNPDNGNVTIYDRDLTAGSTQVVSTDEGGTALENGSGVAELDISGNGSRVLIGETVGPPDSAGNQYWHLYMHVGSAEESIDLTPGVGSTGVLYDGMSSDGTRVYFTTTHAYPGDSDTSADIYRADVTSSSATWTRVSSGSGAGDIDACDPAPNSYNTDDWNVIPGGPTDCSVVAVGGGGGVAAGEGTIYFLSPEELDGSGVTGAPNLFVAAPGSEPAFVTTLESGANSPVPAPSHSEVRTNGPFVNPEAAAIDHASGSYYVLDNTNASFAPGAFVQKFDSQGHVDTSFGLGGKVNGSTSPSGPFIELGSGFGFPVGVPTQIAVDNDPASPSYRDLYVPDLGNEVIKKFDSSGNYVSQISVSFPGAVAVNPANGHVYVASLFGEAKVFDANGSPVAPTSFGIPAFTPTDIAVDSAGNIYVTDTTKTQKYTSAGVPVGGPAFDANPSYGVVVDPADDHVYVDEGDRVVEYTPAGTPVTTTGLGTITQSVSLGADDGKLVVSNKGGNNVVVYGPAEVASDPSYDSPLVVNSVKSAAVRHTEDFQVTPSGDDAVFTSVIQLSSYDPGNHREIYRFHRPGPSLDCVSCAITNAEATGDAYLTSHGLSITDDGRVFYTTTEPLVLRDTDGRKDVYEWSDGELQLTSTGASPFDSGLLTASADGTDAYFFTLDTLAQQDRNGTLMKIYDARENGGFFVIPESPQCAASDECHGPGTKAAAAPSISSVAGTPTQVKTGKCRKGFVKRGGRCVRRKTHHKPKRPRSGRHTTSRQG